MWRGSQACSPSPRVTSRLCDPHLIYLRFTPSKRMRANDSTSAKCQKRLLAIAANSAYSITSSARASKVGGISRPSYRPCQEPMVHRFPTGLITRRLQMWPAYNVGRIFTLGDHVSQQVPCLSPKR